ncbi:beta-lactamase regulator AmpE [Catenovulum sp. 2E275]|uniref:beta-lactamase regulator AmpE n=1 Tax=Catenovulum sp. 2E275 TaxID=2980497 RepID=UPI0021D155FA|nr:beta-lactamase regulator AmpE [Catenovulum sp. 2E275]MCU4677610.1 beta-lactamase regulator AmpE [Catenovulum sp. 2E275]
MTLLSLILVVLLERLTKPTEAFHYHFYYQKYVGFTQKFFDSSTKYMAELFILIWLAVPVLLTAIIQDSLGHGLTGLIFSVFVLFVCYGCPQHRQSYQHYIEAACRDDKQACFRYADQLGQKLEDDNQNNETLGEALVWVNFRHYFAVIFWFVVFGAAGAVFYVFARNLAKYSELEEDKYWLADAANRLLAILVWLPARLTGFAFLFVGHFSKALPVWLSELLTFNNARAYLIKVAKAAEPVDVPENDALTEPCLKLKLAKRALLFLLCVIAVLTLTGVI